MPWNAKWSPPAMQPPPLLHESAVDITDATHLHTRRVKLWVALAATLGILGSTIGSAEELSGYTGEQLYQRFCASCHGAQGRGDGPVAPALKVMVPDLTRLARRHGATFPAEQVRRIVDGRAVQPPHGARDMPVWGYEFRSATVGGTSGQQGADELIGRLVEYLRSIQAK